MTLAGRLEPGDFLLDAGNLEEVEALCRRLIDEKIAVGGAGLGPTVGLARILARRDEPQTSIRLAWRLLPVPDTQLYALRRFR